MANEGMTPLEIVNEANRLIGDNRAMEAVEKYFSADFIEHNPSVRGGNLEGFIEHLEESGFTDPNRPPMRMTLDRAFESGDLVVTHIHVEIPNSPTLVFMDIYRIEDGKLAEHWDVMQPVPETDVNGRVTMY